MKTFLAILVLSLGLSASETGYNSTEISCNAVTSTGACSTYNIHPADYVHIPSVESFTWQTIIAGGTATTVSVTLQGSIDNVTWSTLDTSTSTSGETRSKYTAAVKFFRCNVGTYNRNGTTLTCQILATQTTGGNTSGGAWGTVSGTLSDQTDLQSALDAKAATASPTLVTPTIASFTNATHNHSNAAGGGTLDFTLIGGSTILPVANGGTNNAFFTVSGPASSAKTFAFPNASSTVLTSNAAVTIAQGGTGTGSTLTGLVRGNSSAMTAAELSGDATTSGSNAVTVTKLNGTSFAGTNGNLVKFGASNIPADASVVAANVVTSSSPGAGIAHFAGSTQAVTSSAVSLTADVTGTLPVGNGGTGATTLAGANIVLGNSNLATGANPGPVPYTSSAGTLSQDASNFCWDATNHRLGIGTCAPAASTDLDIEFSAGALHKAMIHNNTSAIGAYFEASGAGVTQLKMQSRPTAGCSSLGSCGLIATGTAAPIILATNDTNQVFLQTTGELDIGTATAKGGSILLEVAGGVQGTTYNTNTLCSATGTAANPSVASCAAAPAGSFSCATNASAATCTVNTTAVTANSSIIVTESSAEGTQIGVTCNTAPTVVPAVLLATKTAASGFTINMPTIATNPACFTYHIIN